MAEDSRAAGACERGPEIQRCHAIVEDELPHRAAPAPGFEHDVARSTMSSVCSTLWSVISTPMPRCRSPATIVWMSLTAIGSTRRTARRATETSARDERARDLEPAPLAAGELIRLLLAQVFDGELVEELFEPLLPLGLVDIQGFEMRGRFFDAELAEDRRLLRQVADPERARGTSAASNVATVEQNRASSGRISPVIM